MSLVYSKHKQNSLVVPILSEGTVSVLIYSGVLDNVGEFLSHENTKTNKLQHPEPDFSLFLSAIELHCCCYSSPKVHEMTCLKYLTEE